MKKPIVLGFAPTAALRHCEERSNPDILLSFWIASSFLLAMTRSESREAESFKILQIQ